MLFYDKRLSVNNTVACASCHQQSKGFSDSNQFSSGFDGQLTVRHAPGLSNVTYYTNGKAFWDERAASIEDQALVPIQSPVEMGETLANVVSKLGQTTFYPTLFQAAFGTPDVTSDRISQALAQFERSMVSYQSKYDSAFAPGSTTPNFAAAGFTADELAGEQLFNGAGRCSACHTTNAHVSNRVHNIGLDATITDAGAGNGKFKAPSLRNIAVSDRFMHDGRFTSLEEVVQFYSTGVQDSQYLDPLLKTPLQLNFTQQQIDQLVAFLNTLTDNTFLTSSLFSDPFVTLPGDYNGDGVVDEVDYNVWRGNFGDSTSLVADGNGDNVVDGADYLIWRKNVGKTWQDLATGAGGELAGAPVPEPAALVLAGITLICGWAYRCADDRHDETGVTRARRNFDCIEPAAGDTGRRPQRR